MYIKWTRELFIMRAAAPFDGPPAIYTAGKLFREIEMVISR